MRVADVVLHAVSRVDGQGPVPSAPAPPARAGRGPDVRFPPPFLFVAGFGVGLLLHRLWPLPLLTGGRSPALVAVGWILVALGLGFGASGFLTFLRMRTAIIPNQPASRLVVRGPYRFSRNPMYVGFAAVYLGGILLCNTWWPLFLLPVVLGSLVALVIRREEKYLLAEFGSEYAEYCRRVRRWL